MASWAEHVWNVAEMSIIVLCLRVYNYVIWIPSNSTGPVSETGRYVEIFHQHTKHGCDVHVASHTMLYKRKDFSPCGRVVTKTPNSLPARERLELCLISTLHPDMFELFRLSLRVHSELHYCLQCSETTRMESGTNAVYTHQSDSRLFVPTRVHSY